ncbi:hypothetical protein [Flavobacterium johnsoniae]|uniref:Uncharacterized protein n=1 Tax=Flavobacterium johnsoniae TaxID=986 RepID=A0A1M5KCW8_FLAJO|nr:hypothetical protein [Flavobacterium johnsoniae]SHG50480.1 hypothetical protein SAMN05444388_10319 [Flavobacterium johnsoniae]
MSEEAFPDAVLIPLGKAKEWEKRYQDDNTIEDPKTKVRSFLIPRETLEKVLKLETEVVRACLAINDNDERTLLFVGANRDEKTGEYINVYGEGTSYMARSAEDEAEEIVYDGIRPSPPY